MRRIRDEEEPLRIWIDAVCIDQQNVDEKNEHVRIMDRIYSHADEVYMWLGEWVGNEHDAIDALDEAQNVLVDVLTREDLRGVTKMQIQAEIVKHERTKNISWEALAPLVGQPWVSTLQESVASGGIPLFLAPGHARGDAQLQEHNRERQDLRRAGTRRHGYRFRRGDRLRDGRACGFPGVCRAVVEQARELGRLISLRRSQDAFGAEAPSLVGAGLDLARLGRALPKPRPRGQRRRKQ
ncbi:hypothetical protein SODALDRAFT_185661 [Sodiomyces alkalinus F11]|uniref:Heterokaryon incompatibility domain-containing protein n=1 Tax=Sodiomyces alkalinus (strain CBS 110278 / VKM F-3762 / F11) TaxID=1314773 RepID=A0A3N2PUV6_SODAK|nr:hypothetical protein SODALDRAFT_185661 [Sodiomyces alkalinus F11]ROT38281.1 hypothetical protein SODALDRAFT_185661 [Sodiomyces alkalinus F11]